MVAASVADARREADGQSRPMTSTDQTQEDAAAVPAPEAAADAQTAAPPAEPSADEATVQAESAEAQASAEDSTATQASAEVLAEVKAPAPPKPDLSPEATGARLSELFPALFVGPNGNGTWKPIKLKIHADIQARAPGQFSKRALGIFFSRYTTTTAYLRALSAPGAQRHDLDGQPAGDIAEEHRTLAAEEVARRQAIVAERRAAQREAHLQAQREARKVAAEQARAQPNADERPRRPPHDRPNDRPNERSNDRPAVRAPQRPPRPAPRHERGDQRPPRAAPHHAPPPQAESPIAAPREDEDPARRERAALLRAFESSTLTKSNFCVLKRIDEKTLDEALETARKERADRGLPQARRA
jgi:ProP effector